MTAVHDSELPSVPKRPGDEPSGRPLHPPRGTKLWPPEINDRTRLADLFVPRTDQAWRGSAYVEYRMLLALLDPARWCGRVRGGVEIGAVTRQPHVLRGGVGEGDVSAAPIHYIMYDPTARVRVISTQTFQWTTRAGAPFALSALDDPTTQIVAIPVTKNLDGYPWRNPAVQEGELTIRLCDGIGFDEDPTATRQFWPGRKLEPIHDYLPWRFMMKLEYARYAISRLPHDDEDATRSPDGTPDG